LSDANAPVLMVKITEVDSGPRRWERPDLRPHLPLIALALLALVLAFGVRQWLVPLGTGNADEGVYSSEADLFRSGDATLPASTHEPFFRPWLTGERDGHIFFQYQPGWPLVLAVSDSVLGSKVAATALSAAGLVLAIHALALEALGSRRTALIAAAGAALSPLFLLHSALLLAYLFTTMLAAVTLWCGFRAVRRTSTRWAIATGAMLGAMLLTRPFDAVLTGVAVLAIALLAPSTDRARIARLAFVVAAAAVPFLAVALLFNLATTGSFTTFPLSASDPRNRFGFGERGMQVGTLGIDYTLDAAELALRQNLRSAPSWVFGGIITIALAAWAALGRDGRRARLVLVLHLFLFPAGYFFWWATALAGPVATNGVGPHYYVPSFVALLILGADGLARVARRNVVVAVGLVVVMVTVTAYNLPDKVDTAKVVTSLLRDIDRPLDDAPDQSLVFIRSDGTSGFTLLRYPFVQNPPRLDGRVLYPVDRLGENAHLMQELPDRNAYLLHLEIPRGGDLFSPRWVRTRLEIRSGSPAVLRVAITPDVDVAGLLAFATSGNDPVVQALPSTPGSTTDFEVVLAAEGSGAGSGSNLLELSAGPHQVVIGLNRPDNGMSWQRRYDVFVEPDGTVTLIRPGIGEHVIDVGGGPITLKKDISPVVADRNQR
jgi:4-amino-4-deoxy-L-arabinose transferase-like glycosyltransferase